MNYNKKISKSQLVSEIKNRKLVSINVLRYDNSELIAKIELGETNMKREEKLDLILNRLDKMESDFNSRLDKVDSRLDKVDSRLDKVDSRLDKIESDVSQLKTEAINHGWNIK